MHDRILIPIEEHEGTDRALEYGIELAKQNDATIHLLHVTDRLSSRGSFHEGSFGGDIDQEELDKRVLKRAREVLEPYADQVEKAGIETVRKVSGGAPHKRILAYAEESGVDVIVMGTRGRTGLGRPLLGGVTERVVRLSDVPVITIPLNDD